MANNQVLAALSLNIRANTAELERGTRRARQHIDGVSGASRQAGQALRAGFGSLSSFMPQSIGLMGNLNGAIQAGIGILKGATTATNGLKAALVSSGIGAIVVALGVAFSGLAAWVNRTTEGTDEANKLWALLGATFDAVVDKIGIIGSAIGKLLKGDFKGAADEAKRFVSETANIFNEIKEEATEAVKLQERENQLKKDNIAFTVREAELRNEISELILKSRDIELSAEERIQAVNRAQELQKTLYAEKVRLADEEFKIQKRRNELGDSNYDDLQKEADLHKTVLQLQKERNDQVRETTNRQITLIAEIKREVELRKKANEIEPLDSIKIKSNLEAPELPKELTKLDAPEIDNEPVKIALEERAGLYNQYANQVVTGLSIISQFQNNAMQKELAQAGDNEAKKVEIRRKYAKKQQSISIGQAIIAGAQAVLNALSTQPFFPLGLLMAALATGLVAAQVGEIKSAKFANGGVTLAGLSMIGERGPELAHFPQGTRVYSHSDTKNLLSGATAQRVQVEGVIRGEDLYFIQSEVERKKSNSF